MQWEYHIEQMEMPSNWIDGKELAKKWTELQANHLEVMNKLGLSGWEYFTMIGPLFYFKRPIQEQHTTTISIKPDSAIGYEFETK